MTSHFEEIPLRRLRIERRWSQQYIADQIGTTPVSINRWERGKVTPTPYFRLRLSQVFGLDQAILFPGEETPGGTDQYLKDPDIPVLPNQPLLGREGVKQQITSILQLQRTVSLYGLPGVGKTTLALSLAHDQHLPQRDGTLWASIGPRPNLIAIYKRWGTILHMAEEEMASLTRPEEWRQAITLLIASRSFFIVLDDVWSEDIINLLHVGGASCYYIITTRLPLIAHQLERECVVQLDELNESESLQLLQFFAPVTVERERQRAIELIRAVGGLPLALTLCGKYLRAHTYSGLQRRIVSAFQYLSNMQSRLEVEEPKAPTDLHPSLTVFKISLENIIAVSHETLSPEVKHAFYALSLLPKKPDSFSEGAALTVAKCDEATLDQLVDVGLLSPFQTTRFMLHPVISDFARKQLSPSLEQEVRARLVHYAKHLASSSASNQEKLEEESAVLLIAYSYAFEAAMYQEIYDLLIGSGPYFIRTERASLIATYAKEVLHHAHLYPSNGRTILSSLLNEENI